MMNVRVVPPTATGATLSDKAAHASERVEWLQPRATGKW